MAWLAIMQPRSVATVPIAEPLLSPIIISAPSDLTIEEGMGANFDFRLKNADTRPVGISSVAFSINFGMQSGDPSDTVRGVTSILNCQGKTIPGGGACDNRYVIQTPPLGSDENRDSGTVPITLTVRDSTGEMARKLVTVTVTDPVPEPTTFLLFGTGLAAISVYTRLWRKRRC
jgi:hypothetical protein